MITLAPETVEVLRKEASAIEARIQSLRERLAADQKALDGINGLLGIGHVAPAETKPDLSAANLKFRDLIKLVVAEKRGDKMSIADVVAGITAKGYVATDDAKTPLKTKVGNELFKLGRNELIGKDGKGSYWAL